MVVAAKMADGSGYIYNNVQPSEHPSAALRAVAPGPVVPPPCRQPLGARVCRRRGGAIFGSRLGGARQPSVVRCAPSRLSSSLFRRCSPPSVLASRRRVASPTARSPARAAAGVRVFSSVSLAPRSPLGARSLRRRLALPSPPASPAPLAPSAAAARLRVWRPVGVTPCPVARCSGGTRVLTWLHIIIYIAAAICHFSSHHHFLSQDFCRVGGIRYLCRAIG